MIKMETTIGVKLSEAEQQLFADLFNYYDSDNDGVVSHSKAVHLLNSSQLSPQITEQIIELSGSSRLINFGRNEFYLMLKLIAAAQSGLPLNGETLTASPLSIRLPHLSPFSDSHKQQLMVNIDDNNKTVVKGDATAHQMAGHLPPPPTKASLRSNRQWSNQFVNSDNYSNRQFITSPQNHMNLNNNNTNNNNNNNNNHINNDETVQINSRSSSINESNGSPTDCVEKSYNYKDKSWSEFNDREKDVAINWADFDEDIHLLDNEEEDEDEDQCSKSSISSGDESYDIWNITDEQRFYYINQFKTMQTNLNSKITGNTAKDFFEKSGLPIQELSSIWQLSDVDKDGALTLDEFCAAMHLVVLRRNNVELPDKLPLTLMPAISPLNNGITSSLNSSKCNDMVSNSEVVYNSEVAYNSISPQYITNDLNEVKGKSEDTLSPQNKEWTKFTDSPTSNVIMTTVSSPPSTSSSTSGMQQLANFDFSAASIVRNPKILHPVALRLSPDGQPIRYDNIETNNPNHDIEVGNQLISTTDTVKNVISQPLGKKDPPPPPPPRPLRHARSSSLDLNKIIVGSSVSNDLIAAHIAPHLKVSNSEYGLSGTLNEYPIISSINSSNLGAFVAYKKTSRHETSLNSSNSLVENLLKKYKIPPEVPIPKNPNDIIESLQTVKALQEYSRALISINNDILQELIQVTQDKHRLESQLAQLNNGYKL